MGAPWTAFPATRATSTRSSSAQAASSFAEYSARLTLHLCRLNGLAKRSSLYILGRPVKYVIHLSDADEGPVFVRIARTIARDIRAGRLRPESKLPGSRALANHLGVHRNTVVAAYDELRAEGWIETETTRGTFIARDLPVDDVDPRLRTRMNGRVPFALRPAPKNPNPFYSGAIDFPMQGGLPDLREIPSELIARAYRRNLRLFGKRLLSYGEPRGHLRLRIAIAEMVASMRGIVCTADEVLITRGSQMGLLLAGRTTAAPGDIIAVESYGYPPAWAAFRESRAKLAPIAVDGDGIIVDRVAQIAETGSLRAVYVTPHHQYPTGAMLSASRRIALLELAAHYRFAVIEDDYDHEFHYRGHPVLPIASQDPNGSVIYLGTLSKVLAPGIRMGYVVAPRPVIDRMAEITAVVDRQGDQAMECAVAELFESGDLARHVRKMKRMYQARREALAAQLDEHLEGVLEYSLPQGGMALWAKTVGIDAASFAQACLERGVAISEGRRFTFDRRARPFVRIGFAATTPTEIEKAVRIMKRIVHG